MGGNRSVAADKEAKSSVVKDGKLQKFVLVIRTGVAVTAYFDGVTIVEKP